MNLIVDNLLLRGFDIFEHIGRDQISIEIIQRVINALVLKPEDVDAALKMALHHVADEQIGPPESASEEPANFDLTLLFDNDFAPFDTTYTITFTATDQSGNVLATASVSATTPPPQ